MHGPDLAVLDLIATTDTSGMGEEAKIRKPKYEIRISISASAGHFDIRVSSLFRISIFEFRILQLRPGLGARLSRVYWGRTFANGMRILGFQPRAAQILALNGLVHLLSVHGYFRGRVNAQSHFIAADIDNRDNNVVADNDAFVALSRQDEHRGVVPSISRACFGRERPMVFAGERCIR
jgi:hypothetical protein